MEELATRGIVMSDAGRKKFALSRFEPSKVLQPFIEHYWIVRYGLPAGVTHTQTILSYPNVHLAFERDEAGCRALLYGVPKRPFVIELRGTGCVLGIKFRAGGFYPFWKRNVSQLTGFTIAASEVFGPDADHWTLQILDSGDDEAMARQADALLTERLPGRDAQAELAGRIVQEAMSDPAIVKVEQLCERTGFSSRQLQRLFGRYIGVTPKWVIKRFRLQEAAERLERDESAQCAQLALQLGYFDQAHFIKDFKAVLGQSPAHYRKRARESQ
jgi:AraC-like DNA-binding protein